jgi:hypothetical protein
MKHKRNWLIAIAITTGATLIGLQTINAPTQITEITAPASGTCYYVWATKDAPDLTTKLDANIKVLNETAIASVTYYGEDCIYQDGTSTFGAMETDFKIRLPVDDLTKHEEFGNWISQTMQVVTQIPREEIQGNWGYVEFRFEKSESENIVLRVPIQFYVEEIKDKTGLELFNYFYIQP